MSDILYECQRLLRQLHRDCTAITSQHEQAMAEIEQLYQPIGSITPTPSAPPVPQAPAAPTEKRWKYLGHDGLIPPELSLRAARDPRLFAEICEEVQEAADEAKQQN